MLSLWTTIHYLYDNECYLYVISMNLISYVISMAHPRCLSGAEFEKNRRSYTKNIGSFVGIGGSVSP